MKVDIGKAEIVDVLESEKTLVLATCAGSRVTIRPMSHVNDGLSVFFQADSHSLKMRQISENPLVALCVGTYEIEGKATVLGHPLAEGTLFFAEKYKAKHPGSFAKYSSY